MTTKEKLYAISEEEACMDAEWHRPFTFKTAWAGSCGWEREDLLALRIEGGGTCGC